MKRVAISAILVSFFCLVGVFFDEAESITALEKLEELEKLGRLARNAEVGDPTAQYELAQFFSSQNRYKEAVHWFLKAAEQGHTSAQAYLAYMYSSGIGTLQNYKRAIYWNTKAAEQGSSMAQHNLGLMFFSGEGVFKDYVTAYVWLNLSAAQDHPSAIGNRDLVRKKMTPQQVIEAQKLSEQYQYIIDHTTENFILNENPKVDLNELDGHEPEANNHQNKANKKTGFHQPQIKSSGTGFIITEDGYVLTCHHIIDGAGSIKVLKDDIEYPATISYDDKDDDLTLLKISGQFPALAFSSDPTAKIGQEVFTMGYPNPLMQGLNSKFTEGNISSLTGFQDDVRLYQISVPVQPGNSGGPLLDRSGNVLGVVVAVLNPETAFKISGFLPQNVNYAIKSHYARAITAAVPKLADKLVSPSNEVSFDSVVSRVIKSVVMVVVYE